MRYTIHTHWNGSDGTYASIHNTFAEVLAYLQAVCDINCDASDLKAKIIDREKNEITYDGPLNHEILTKLKCNYEKGLII